VTNSAPSGRHAHIAALDRTLEELKAAEVVAADRLNETLDKHISLLDEIDRIIHERVEAYYAIGRCESAIRKLGYCLMANPHDGSLDIQAEKESARKRVNREAKRPDGAA
jgi:hypothetical protein